jgi:hypothetical protein
MADDLYIIAAEGLARLHAPLLEQPQGLAWTPHGAIELTDGSTIDWTPQLARLWCCDLIAPLLEEVASVSQPIDLETLRTALHYARQAAGEDPPAPATLSTAQRLSRRLGEQLRAHCLDRKRPRLGAAHYYLGEAVATCVDPRGELVAGTRRVPLASRVALACLLVAEHLVPEGSRLEARWRESDRQREALARVRSEATGQRLQATG